MEKEFFLIKRLYTSFREVLTTSISHEKSPCQLSDNPNIGHTAFVKCSKQFIGTKIEQGVQCTTPALRHLELNRFVVNYKKYTYKYMLTDVS